MRWKCMAKVTPEFKNNFPIFVIFIFWDMVDFVLKILKNLPQYHHNFQKCNVLYSRDVFFSYNDQKRGFLAIVREKLALIFWKNDFFLYDSYFFSAKKKFRNFLDYL